MKPRTVALVSGVAVAGLVIQGVVVLVLLAGNSAARGPVVRQVPAPNNGWVFGQAPMVQAAEMPEAFLEVPVPPAEQPLAEAAVDLVRGPAVAARDYELSEPVTHKNLTVFFVHGPSTMQQKVITLHEALEQNLAVVHEGGLAVDNRSNRPLFIQGGDIVKGGNQDRVLPYDYLIPPGPARSPVTAFCVEAGRSSPRAGEVSSSFQVSSAQLPTRSLKLAALVRRSQNDIWQTISQTQASLSQNVGGSVKAQKSQTSLQLTLEHPLVHEAVQSYVNELTPLAQRKENAIGVVVAINGKVQTADVYASSDLFLRLWPKLLQASAVAAVAERPSAEAAPLTGEAAQAFLAEAERGQATRQAIGQLTLLRHETDRAVMLETCTGGQANAVLHRCFLAK